MRSKNSFSSISRLYQEIDNSLKLAEIRKKIEKDFQENEEKLKVRGKKIIKESQLNNFIINNLIYDKQTESNKHELTLKEFKKSIKNLSIQHCEILIKIKNKTNKPFDYITWNTTDLFAESGKQLNRTKSTSYCRSKDNLEERKLIIFCKKDKRKDYIALTELGFLIAECIENLKISKPILNKFKKHLDKALPSTISFDTLKATLKKCKHLLENGC